jgi:hypothetical protein
MDSTAAALAAFDAMGSSSDFTAQLWLLKLGALLNLYFLSNTVSSSSAVDVELLIPARIFFVVSAYRCLFPVRYEHNVVFHDSPFSSIFLTRLLATFSEVTYVYQFSAVLRLLNVNHVVWVDALSWVMVLQVVISQCLVWGAILTERLALYFYEELGWATIFAINTIASGYLCATVDNLGDAKLLLYLSLLFGAGYLPWQLFHLRALHAQAERDTEAIERRTPTWTILKEGLRRSLRARNPRRDAASWGGFIGLTWMIGYWATLIPLWVNTIVVVSSRHAL